MQWLGAVVRRWKRLNIFFLECEKVVRLWYKVVGWVGLSWVPQRNIVLHLLSFANLKNGKRWKRRLGGLWICFVWVVWKWRNPVLFSRNEWDFKRIEEEIKCRFWNWCVVKHEEVGKLSYVVWSQKTLYETWNRG